LDSEEIVMKKVGAQLEGRKAFAGATFMGDGTVGLILNVDGIAELSEVHLKFADVSKSSRVVAVNRKNDVLLVDIDVPGDFGVPMDSVYRLEDFDPDQVRNSIDRSIVVYRDQAMPLVDLSVVLKTGINGRFKPEPVPMQNRERAFVLVFRTRAGQFFGCVVDRIKDFLTIEEDLLQTNRSYACVKGSIILENRVISVLDPDVVVDVATRVFDQPAAGADQHSQGLRVA
jgi:two-component system chemotaxis sensor kinase CheA